MISILVTTFNRLEKLKRCLASIASQTYTDYEIIVINDCSTDGTKEFLDAYPDKRLKHVWNETNIGSKDGDRPHIKRFLEMCNGEYFVYLCDDDFWLFSTLLARQIALFKAIPELGMIIGGQFSRFRNHTKFHERIYPVAHMNTAQFLNQFSEYPIECNLIAGATLYRKDKFIESGALTGNGSRWQAGYELSIAPACYGDVYYIDQPCIEVEVDAKNASFLGTQLSHYQDSIVSVNAAFRKPLEDFPKLLDIKKKIIHNIGQAYLRNADHIKEHGKLTMCSRHNISQPVTVADLVA